MFLSTGCSLLRAEGFSCSLGVLYGGLGISKLQFFIKKIESKFPAINFFSILGHQTLDPDPESGSTIRKNAGSDSESGSALNQCGSETLRRGTISFHLCGRNIIFKKQGRFITPMGLYFCGGLTFPLIRVLCPGLGVGAGVRRSCHHHQEIQQVRDQHLKHVPYVRYEG
jgi:hypothetical protein